MPVMLKDGRSVLFIHVPKNGGSTVERLFTSSGWDMSFRMTRRGDPDAFPLLRVSPQHYHGALLTEVFNLRRFDLVFLITRHPVSRFRSEFAMRHKHLGHLETVDSAIVDEWADRFFSRYADNHYAHDNHLRRQVDFLVPDAEVFRLEDGMDSIVADLNARFDLDLRTTIPRRLSSAARGLPSSAVEVSPQLLAHLHEFYADDFERFGYLG